jgi:hypothetical protein
MNRPSISGSAALMLALALISTTGCGKGSSPDPKATQTTPTALPSASVQSSPEAKSNPVAAVDEILNVTCKHMIPAAGPDAYVLDHLKFNLTKGLLWTEKYGNNSAAPTMPLHVDVSPSQVTWKIDAYTEADGTHVYETHSFDRKTLVLSCPGGPFGGAYTEQGTVDKP